MDATGIRALLRPEAFPDGVSEPVLVETHISWVVLTGEIAYKIKKPVAMEFLDFSTLEARRHYCREEVRLNRRLAPELYLGVVEIRDSADGPVIGGTGADGPVIEYAVRMRQFDQRRLASRMAAEGRLTPALCREMGRTIARFHNGLEPLAPPADEDSRAPGTPGAIFAAARQNFEQIDATLPAREDRSVLRQLEEAAVGDFERLERRMWHRLEGGYVRECHGDLHLGNIVLADDRVLPFDCIEFNPTFRLVDIQCEIGFVVMDLESRELPGEANRVLNTWLEHTGDYAGLRLHVFYDVYLALVRAKISLFSAVAAAGNGTPDLGDYRRYLALAAAGRRRLPGFLCLMMGVSGSGKSTIAEALAARYSAIRLRSDVERKRLYDLAPSADSADAGLTERLYSPATSDRVYAQLAHLAETVLDAGLPVIVDATFLEHRRRSVFRELAAQRRLPFLLVHCIAGEAELERRLTARRRDSREASEADVVVMRGQLESVEPPDEQEVDSLILVDTEGPDYQRRLESTVERRITAHRRR
ncbi:MAG: AAA family ATPase [Gammaproteobacteria bacterium]|jgi:aminoglycoside phosphotransferase family enzyme/predicted kinase